MSQYLFIEKYRQIYFCFHFQEWGVQMWELDQKEGWAPKNRYFWIAVLEKTPESPSDCKEIKAVLKEILKEINTKYSLEGLMLKLQYFGHLMQRADSLEKILMLGKVEGRRRSGQQRMRWLDGITNSRDMNLSQIPGDNKDRETWSAAVHGVAKSWTQVSSWKTTTSLSAFCRDCSSVFIYSANINWSHTLCQALCWALWTHGHCPQLPWGVDTGQTAHWMGLSDSLLYSLSPTWC